MSMIHVSPSVQPRMQPTATSCWLTCLEMLYQWKNDQGDRSKDSSSILSVMNESPYLEPWEMKAKGIAVRECKETAQYLGLGFAGDTKIIDAKVLTYALKHQGLLWVAGRWYMNCDHVIVVTGCNPETGKIKYINPWKNYGGLETDGTVDWLADRGDVWTNCDASVMYWR